MSSTYYGILLLSNIIIKCYLLLVIIWTTIVAYSMVGGGGRGRGRGDNRIIGGELGC